VPLYDVRPPTLFGNPVDIPDSDVGWATCFSYLMIMPHTVVGNFSKTVLRLGLLGDRRKGKTEP
jgi:hypothetical protein